MTTGDYDEYKQRQKNQAVISDNVTDIGLSLD